MFLHVTDAKYLRNYVIWLRFNNGAEGEIDLLWAKEAERRVSQIEQGDVELIPGEEVFAKIRRKYRKGLT